MNPASQLSPCHISRDCIRRSRISRGCMSYSCSSSPYVYLSDLVYHLIYLISVREVRCEATSPPVSPDHHRLTVSPSRGRVASHPPSLCSMHTQPNHHPSPFHFIFTLYLLFYTRFSEVKGVGTSFFEIKIILNIENSFTLYFDNLIAL